MLRNMIVLLLLVLYAHDVKAQQTFTVMSYNIENAFDTIHDEGKNDYEYCADGKRRWSTHRLLTKLKGVGKVIAAADERKPIDLIGLCEVENDTVMTHLTQHTPLQHLGYRYIMTHSSDQRGIDVALLYSPFTFHPIENHPIRPNTGKRTTRDFLHVAGIIAGGDTLDVYVLHLPSKRGGKEAEKQSMRICHQLQTHTDSVRTQRQHPNLIIMGDFNAEPHSPQLKLLTQNHHLIDRTAKLPQGTYKYQGEWSTLDHILTHTTTLAHQHTRILTLPFLTEPDRNHGNTKPRRTYLGFTYQGGISDHLPVVSVFQIER
ncbi:MAG: endonuclease/exonuclease/phosphatase family protein [Bacteroidaceae bacterium]|nr:endonuclease/exonuclease/phosphatase family protein [Bacteroidaceae bacterium]